MVVVIHRDNFKNFEISMLVIVDDDLLLVINYLASHYKYFVGKDLLFYLNISKLFLLFLH